MFFLALGHCVYLHVNVRHVHWTKRLYTPPFVGGGANAQGQGVCLGGDLVGKLVIGYYMVEFDWFNLGEG